MRGERHAGDDLFVVGQAHWVTYNLVHELYGNRTNIFVNVQVSKIISMCEDSVQHQNRDSMEPT